LDFFGLPGANLTGDLVQAAFKLDTAVGIRGPLPANPPAPAATDSVMRRRSFRRA
jgi:hypothetical protein